MSDVTRALEQLDEIHTRLARAEVYRGWRPVPVALSGVAGLAVAAYQTAAAQPIEPVSFVLGWLLVALVALAVGCVEIVWHYGRRASAADRRRTELVLGQFLPALVAGFLASLALLRLSPVLATILPGVWALLFGVGIFAARPFLPRSSGFVAAYYWVAGLSLLWTCRDIDTLAPWMVGGVFGAGQLIAALVLYREQRREFARHSARLGEMPNERKNDT